MKITYKFVKGDEIDMMFGQAMIKCGCQVKVNRLSVGMYMFGSRKIIAKIVNGRLMIRVGGGFMTIIEFITQYGPMEMLKAQQSEKANIKMRGTNFTSIDTSPRGKRDSGGTGSPLRNAKTPDNNSRKTHANIANIRKSMAMGMMSQLGGGGAGTSS